MHEKHENLQLFDSFNGNYVDIIKVVGKIREETKEHLEIAICRWFS